MKMQMTNSFLLLCLLYIVKASMYSNSDSIHLHTLCESSLLNSSCTREPNEKIKNCDIPLIYRSLYITNQLDFDEIDGSNVDGSCCCPTKLQFFIKSHHTYMKNTNNEEKKLAFTECTDTKLWIPIGKCDKQMDTCGKCREIQRKHRLLIEENGQYKFDWFELPSHCTCSA